MIILPLGHDKEIFNFTYVTAGIIVICLGVQVYAAFTTPGEEAMVRMQQEEMQVRMRLWSDYGQEWAEERFPDLCQAIPELSTEFLAMVKEMSKMRQAFFKEVDAGRIVPESDPDRQELKALAKRRDALQGILALGYHRDRGAHTLVTYAFIHGGWLHLIGNMIFLYLCGCNMEDRWGRLAWMGLYFIGGIAAALAWAGFNPSSRFPLVGASGAIAAAMGAFLITNATANIQFFYFMWFLGPIRGTFVMKAYWALPFWALQQLLGMWTEGYTAVAYSAHVGGFLLGLLAAVVLKHLGIDRKLQSASMDKAMLYTQHPLYMQGLDLLQGGNSEGAASRFEQLLREKPDHLDAALELYRLKQDPAQAATIAGRVIVLARRTGDIDTPLITYNDLGQRFPDAHLDDRSLFAVAECFEKKEDARAAAETYQKMLSLHPDSVVAPKAMINIGQIYLTKLSMIEQGQSILQEVVDRFAGSPFADRANEMLQRGNHSVSLGSES